MTDRRRATVAELQLPDLPGHVPCMDADPDLFHPAGPHDLNTMQQAAAVCATCPVTGLCASYAARKHETGVWGGRYFTGGVSRRITPPGETCPVHRHPAGWTTYKTWQCRCDVCRAWLLAYNRAHPTKPREGAA